MGNKKHCLSFNSKTSYPPTSHRQKQPPLIKITQPKPLNTKSASHIHTKYTMETISARIELNEYANKVLAVVKAKHQLKDKSEAINLFIETYGDDVVEKEATEEYVKKIGEIADNHFKKYGKRKMSLKELDKLCGIDNV